MINNTQNIDVSIIIPTYNRLWCLPRAIESCLNTKCNSEIIVVDDGSSDGTWEWLQNQPVVSIRQDNQGQTYAINKGFSAAKGKYIRFLDSDDFLEKGIIDTQFEKAEANSADLVYSRVDNFDEESKQIKRNPDVPLWEDFMEVQLGSEYGSHFLGMLFHRRLVEKVPRRPDFALREDRMFLLEVGLLNPKLAVVEGNAGYWVNHSQQMQGNYLGLRSQVANWQHLNIYKRILKELEKKGELTVARKNAACNVLWHLAHWISKEHIREAVEVYDWIKKLNPNFTVPGNEALRFLYPMVGFKKTKQILFLRRLLRYGVS